MIRSIIAAGIAAALIFPTAALAQTKPMVGSTPPKPTTPSSKPVPTLTLKGSGVLQVGKIVPPKKTTTPAGGVKPVPLVSKPLKVPLVPKPIKKP